MRGGLFSYGGGYFPFFTENRPQKHKKHAILHPSQTNGGGLEPPPPPPGYATGIMGVEGACAGQELVNHLHFQYLGLRLKISLV